MTSKYQPEVERQTADTCDYEPAHVKVADWTVVESDSNGGDDGQNGITLGCNRMALNTTVRIAPMDRQYGGWDSVHFHPNLRLPMDISPSKGVTIMLEGETD